ncbi:MAG: heavy-metal-associated domain-containing protein [Cyclobacteriaceae bacterium]|nr:heavy-metal-associated domain-containing protein [Cyclobacteriaceae bacterium]
MKTIVILFSLIAISSTAFAQSGVVTSQFKVYGNCTMCKKRIETALDHKGIKQASWDVKSKELKVTYNSARINEKQIHQLVADAGHDTELVKAKDETYAGLPFCCLYRDGDSGHQHQ